MPRFLLAVAGSAAFLTGCGASSSGPPAAGQAPASTSPAAGARATASAAASARPVGTAAAAAAGSGATGSTTTGSGTTGAGTRSGTTKAGAAEPGAATTSTAAGTYTYDNTGTVTAGTPRDASGTSTLTVDPPAGSRQHTRLAGDQSSTDQDTVVRPSGTLLARLAMTNPAFSKEFRPPAPVLLVPDPADPGKAWHWSMTSTDGKTTATVTARVVRRETLTIGGRPVTTSLVTSTLRLTGDVSFTAQAQTWYDAAHRLSVKDHTKGSGTVSGLHFTTDITSVLRSLTPS